MLLNYFIYVGRLLALTLGLITVCGLAVHLCSRGFSRLTGSGSGAVFDITSLIGTPVHELGHAIMCLLFGHRILRVKLLSLRPENGVYGFVEHSYNQKNPWARLGNLFIAVGPIFSGLAVTVLMLLLCFPTQWSDYLASSRLLLQGTPTPAELIKLPFSLLKSMPAAFSESWLRALPGLLVILSVSLHVTLSWQDIKSALGALPLYLALVLLFGIPTFLLAWNGAITGSLLLLNLRMLSVFCLVIAFSAVWLALALLVRLIRLVISWF